MNRFDNNRIDKSYPIDYNLTLETESLYMVNSTKIHKHNYYDEKLLPFYRCIVCYNR